MTATTTGASETFARQIFTRGTDIFGAKELSDVWGVEVSEDSVPSIPFTEAELARARELGQVLYLQVPAITMKFIHSWRKNKTSDGKKLLYDIGWYKAENFFLEETMRLGWRLATRDVIPGSRSQNYLQQTKTLCGYLRDQVFAGQELPTEAEAAIAEFQSREKELSKLLSEDWKEAAKQLATLSVNQLYRDRPVEALHRLTLYEAVNHERLLPEGTWNWTNSRSSNGNLVCLGSFDSGGVSVGYAGPDSSAPGLGVCFSRSGNS